MFFIFGWNHKKQEDFGGVEEHACENCNNTRLWNLTEISSYFTLFFIPIFPHDKEHWLRCPICTYGIKLDKEDFASYKSISEINTSFSENNMTEEEKNEQTAAIHTTMNKRYEGERKKSELESGKWRDVVAEKTDEELIIITTKKRVEYDLVFLIAAENEIKNRKINS